MRSAFCTAYPISMKLTLDRVRLSDHTILCRCQYSQRSHAPVCRNALCYEQISVQSGHVAWIMRQIHSMPATTAAPDLLAVTAVGGSLHLLQHLFTEDLCGGLPSKAFLGVLLRRSLMSLISRICEFSDVTLAWQPPSGPPVGVLDGAFLPR